MEIIEAYGIEAAATARGHVVIIDVLRACTTAAYAFARGVSEIVIVSTAEEAFRIKETSSDMLIVGEEGGRMIPGFDYGNSPDQISKLNIANRRMILRSSSGTQGVTQAREASEILLASLVNAKATVQYLKNQRVPRVTLLAMGSRNGPDKEEDIACRDYMARLLQGRPVSKASTVMAVVESASGRMALDPSIDYKTPRDLDLATEIDTLPFAIVVSMKNGRFIARSRMP